MPTLRRRALAAAAAFAVAVPVAAQAGILGRRGAAPPPPAATATTATLPPPAATGEVTAAPPAPAAPAAAPAEASTPLPPRWVPRRKRPAPQTPTDYRKVTGLSRPVHATERVPTFVETHDGEVLYVEVTKPKGTGRWPVIMEASPYHGTLADREGTRIFPDPKNASGEAVGLTGYFAPRGYAVVMVDLRGTGKSSGCLDHLGPADARDLKAVVEWAATRPWSNGRVGMTGHSYVGSTPAVAAAQRPKGLVTIAPSAGLASMYDHQFQRGVPYYLQWAGPQWAYERIALESQLPGGESFGRYPEDTGCGLKNSAVTAGHGQVNGQYQDWHRQRDWEKAATSAPIPVFMVHGVNDNAARIPSAEWFFGRRFDRRGDKVWLGQWDHGSPGNTTCDEAHPNCRFEQWQYALHAWFDRHLQRRDVDTGPPVEVFLNGERVWVDRTWRRPRSTMTLYPDAVGLRLAPGAGKDSSAAFAAAATAPRGEGTALEFVSAPLRDTTVLVGLPRLRLVAAQTNPGPLNLVAVLERIGTETRDGRRRAVRAPMTYCAIQTQLREGIDKTTPAVPGEPMVLDPQCFTMAHTVHKGERVALSVRTTSPHHLSNWSADPRVVVFTGREGTAIRLPVVPGAVLHPDVELRSNPLASLPAGAAQRTVTATVPAGTPGAGERTMGVTSVPHEFDVLGTADGIANARMEVLARFTAPGDYDLYLARRLPDGTWTDDLAAGESGNLDAESLALSWPQLRPGRYRLEVHNWAGPPGNPIELTITFFDRHGRPGPRG